MKRAFDIFFSIIGLVIVFLVILLSWIVAAVETKSNGFFIQTRVGQYGNLFTIYKIKTMKVIQGVDSSITSFGDVRITKSGAFFRKTKIDELPQLWNVLTGNMSFVGPRPDVPGYADKLKGSDRIVLSVKPGITGPAQIAYRNEEKLLETKTNPVSYNNTVIWPDKVEINKIYIKNRSFFKDINYIWKTVRG